MEINQKVTINNRHYTITAFDVEPYDNHGHRCVNLVDSKGREKFAIFCGESFQEWQRTKKGNLYSSVRGMR